MGLGVHLTLELDGGCKLGPDAEVTESWTDFGPAEHKRAAFKAAGEALLGPIEALWWDSCSYRPRLDGDFVIRRDDGVTHLLGIESPGLTASLALAEVVLAG